MRALMLTLALSACATAQPRTPIDPPLTAPPAAQPRAPLEGDVMALSLSGGGARAASFAYGALLELRDMRAPDGRSLLDHVALVSSVSGGSLVAAYFGQHGSAGLDGFRAAYLDKDWNGGLRSLTWPGNWAAVWRGGLNSETDLADRLDAEIFNGATMADLNGPRIVLNALDLYQGAPFSFTPTTFDALCADLSRVRIADAVAASMAFPLYFRPFLVQSHEAYCPPQPDWIARAETDRAMPALQRAMARAFRSYRESGNAYVHVIDGGVVDNLGLSALTLERQAAATPYGPLTAQEAVRVRRITFLVVNAEGIRTSDWQERAAGPDASDTFDAIFGIAIEAPNRAAYDIFRATMADWRDAIVAWRCTLAPGRAAELGAEAGWACADFSINVDMIRFTDLDPALRDRLGGEPTQVSLPPEEVDALIEGGRSAVRGNAAAQAMTQ